MDANRKLPQFLQILGFSLVFLMLIGMASCRYHVIAEFSFHNKLNEDVELYLYVNQKDYSQKIPPYSMILKDDNVTLISLESSDRDGFGGDYFHQLVDSAKVKIHGQEFYIAIWRQNKDAELAEGYESLKDFYKYWSKIHQHGGSHAEYAYTLKLVD
jgi:hypothetical protein